MEGIDILYTTSLSTFVVRKPNSNFYHFQARVVYKATFIYYNMFIQLLYQSIHNNSQDEQQSMHPSTYTFEDLTYSYQHKKQVQVVVCCASKKLETISYFPFKTGHLDS